MFNFTNRFQLDINKEILSEATPNHCHCCAIALAMRQQVPADICPENDIGFSECEIDDEYVRFEVTHYDESGGEFPISFNFKMSAELFEWMEKFDYNIYVPPIKINCVIESSDISSRYIYSTVKGQMTIA